MRFVPVGIEGAYVVELEPIEDERGFFARTWCREEFASAGLNPDLSQCSLSRNTRAGTLRGMHFQRAPHEEAKLVRCTRGAVFDVVVDLRAGSPTQVRVVRNRARLRRAARRSTCPKGCAHGFQTLIDDTDVLYMISHPYVARGGGRRSLGRPRVRDRVARGRGQDDQRARPCLAGLRPLGLDP